MRRCNWRCIRFNPGYFTRRTKYRSAERPFATGFERGLAAKPIPSRRSAGWLRVRTAGTAIESLERRIPIGEMNAKLKMKLKLVLFSAAILSPALLSFA